MRIESSRFIKRFSGNIRNTTMTNARLKETFNCPAGNILRAASRKAYRNVLGQQEFFLLAAAGLYGPKYVTCAPLQSGPC